MRLFEVKDTGIITIDYSEIKSELIDAFRKSFGQDLNIDAATPQGQLILIMAEMINHFQINLLKVYNSFNPYTATGVGLDNVGALFGYYRRKGAPTSVYITLKGKKGVVVPSGFILSDKKGEKYKALDDITIEETGQAVALFQNVNVGKIPAPAGTVTEIETPIEGLESATNQADGTVGNEAEDDYSFKSRIVSNWLNIRGTSHFTSLLDKLKALPGVIDLYGVENPSSKVLTTHGINVDPHGIGLVILGGKGEDIAEVIFKTKSLGCATSGNTFVTYKDKISGAAYRYNIYRPKPIPIKIKVYYKKTDRAGTDALGYIKQKIASYILQNPIKITDTLTGLSFAGADLSAVQLIDIKINFASEEGYKEYINLSYLQQAFLSPDYIEIEEV